MNPQPGAGIVELNLKFQLFNSRAMALLLPLTELQVVSGFNVRVKALRQHEGYQCNLPLPTCQCRWNFRL